MQEGRLCRHHHHICGQAKGDGGNDLLYDHTLDVSTSRTLSKIPWPSLLWFPLQIFSGFQIQNASSGSALFTMTFPQKNFVPGQHLVQEWCSQYFWVVLLSTVDCQTQLWGSRIQSSNSCSSVPHAWKSPFMQCYTRKRGTRTLLGKSFCGPSLLSLCHLPA